MATVRSETGDSWEQALMSVAPMVLAMGASMALSKVVTALWSRRRGVAPPTTPGTDDVGWAAAVVWAASMGAAAGVTKLLVRRGTQKRLEHRALVRRA